MVQGVATFEVGLEQCQASVQIALLGFNIAQAGIDLNRFIVRAFGFQALCP
ncbi:hypothetical protein D3C81_1832660 [compost metagenome]